MLKINHFSDKSDPFFEMPQDVFRMASREKRQKKDLLAESTGRVSADK